MPELALGVRHRRLDKGELLVVGLQLWFTTDGRSKVLRNEVHKEGGFHYVVHRLNRFKLGPKLFPNWEGIPKLQIVFALGGM